MQNICELLTIEKDENKEKVEGYVTLWKKTHLAPYNLFINGPFPASFSLFSIVLRVTFSSMN